uniref:PAS domain-containing serine/threonine-protein kinase-like n=1 Tax=Styela clava TaxID=7725 RepID=UPI00193A7473|nr:PAS domain-containing serine/threonine-protein kinase-like [Styela clava]
MATKPLVLPVLENSFEHNQSFPVVSKNYKRSSFGIGAKAVDNLTGEEYDSYSYRKDASYPCQLPSVNKSSNNSSFADEKEDILSSSFSKDRHRALLTVKADNLKILTINKIAAELFGYTFTELIGKHLSCLFKELVENENSKDASINSICDSEGNIIATSGKIIDVTHKKGLNIPVSIWTKLVEDASGTQCCIIVIEPVERISCLFDFNEQGKVIYCDEKFAMFHGIQSTDLHELPLNKLMPSYVLPTPGGCNVPKEIRLQNTVSRPSDGSSFPVTVFISSHQKTKKTPSVSRSIIFKAKMWIFPHVSGLITCKSNGEIRSVNENFSQYLFGYHTKEMNDMNITEIIPSLLVGSEDDGNLYNSAFPQIEMDSSLNFSCQEDENLKVKDDEETTDESWVELSVLEKQTREKMASLQLNEPRNQDDEKQHSDFLDKINALLNNSTSNAIEQQNGQESHAENVSSTNKSCKEESSTNSDSAIHSICSNACKCAKTSGKTGETESTSFSDYHSADGSQNAVQTNHIHQHHNIDPTNLTVTSQRNSNQSKSSDSVISPSCHDQSSFVIVDDTTNSEVFCTQSKKDNDYIIERFPHKATPAMQRLTLGSEVTSTPVEYGRAVSRLSNQENSFRHLQNGFYKGKFKHKHGALIDFYYELNKVEVENGADQIICLRVFAHTNVPDGYSIEAINSTICTSASTLPSINLSNRSNLLDTVSLNDSRAEIGNYEDQIEKYATMGEFNKKYNVIKTIGSGAFGFVKIAQCIKTREEVVVKFIKKEKVLDECWIHDDELDILLPMEISLLSRFRHPHIITVLDFFENKSFFSMIMPKHGIHGLDLFEFIDRCANGVEEPLSSYIFRQVVSAVDYLHSHNILHRDIKDENIIIDERFNCKLIDFGSATFMKPGRDFATFCGTIEYCSPEVLMGNKYRGPELEMWALGVTLYTLVFGENPFKNVEETITCEVDPPFGVSRDLASLMQWLLQPDPEYRCTISEVLECPWVNQYVEIDQYQWNDVVHTPAGSANSSNIQVACHNDSPLLDAENLCLQLQDKLTSKHAQQQLSNRKVLKPINDLNKTI